MVWLLSFSELLNTILPWWTSNSTFDFRLVCLLQVLELSRYRSNLLRTNLSGGTGLSHSCHWHREIGFYNTNLTNQVIVQPCFLLCRLYWAIEIWFLFVFEFEVDERNDLLNTIIETQQLDSSRYVREKRHSNYTQIQKHEHSPTELIVSFLSLRRKIYTLLYYPHQRKFLTNSSPLDTPFKL